MPFENQNILLVVAHPDDEWFLLEKLKAAKSVKILVLSTSRLFFKQRKFETLEFVNKQEFTNISVEFLGDSKVIWDGDCLNHIDDLASEIADAIHAQSPDLIVSHDYENGHPDHDAVFLSALKASAGRPIDLLCFCSYRTGIGGMLTFFKPLSSTSDSFTLKFSFGELFRMFKLSQHYKTEKMTMSILGTLGLAFLFWRGGMRIRNGKQDRDIIAMPMANSLPFTRYKTSPENYEAALQSVFTEIY